MRSWNGKLYLFTPKEFEQLPDGIELTCIDNTKVIKGKDEIDMDIRGGCIAFGVIDPLNHELGPLFTKFNLD